MSKPSLPPFEGHDVRKATLRLTKAGDGLSEALSLVPKPWQLDAEVYLVIKARVTHVDHKREKEGDPDLVRVHTAEALEATEVNVEEVGQMLTDARERVRLAKDAAAGQANLDLDPSRTDPA